MVLYRIFKFVCAGRRSADGPRLEGAVESRSGARVLVKEPIE